MYVYGCEYLPCIEVCLQDKKVGTNQCQGIYKGGGKDVVLISSSIMGRGERACRTR